MNNYDFAFKKAELIYANNIYIPKNIKLNTSLSKSTAGPSSGSVSIAFTFGGKNVKMDVSSCEKEEFHLNLNNGNFQIVKNGEIFLENVEILPILFHAPRQAFLNIENRCINNCAFCHLSKQKNCINYNDDTYIHLIQQASHRKDFHSIALTSGIYPNTYEIAKRLSNIIIKLKQKMPDTCIGVETCISNQNEISMIKDAGADELKINLQIPDRELFKKICPNLDYDDILLYLEEAVKIFGKGKVSSNIIFGIGESDESLISSINRLTKIGVVPTLRKIRINNLNENKIIKAISKRIPNIGADRILEVALMHKEILEKYKLTTKTFKTMCHKCGCCDLVPYWDI